ncbi:MAG: thioesterase family protein [Bacteroidaceae bacterium]|nr:thioesterase family protein [Bacteroidaceae bacterium]
MEIGLLFEKEFIPTPADSAARMGSGTLNVLSTPSVLAALENVAMTCVANQLSNEETTVGTLANFKHLKASSIDTPFIAQAELIEIDRRRLVFRVKAMSKAGDVLAEGIHERFIVNINKFMGKLA